MFSPSRPYLEALGCQFPPPPSSGNTVSFTPAGAFHFKPLFFSSRVKAAQSREAVGNGCVSDGVEEGSPLSKDAELLFFLM